MRPLKGLLRLPGMVGLLALAPSLEMLAQTESGASVGSLKRIFSTTPRSGSGNPIIPAWVSRALVPSATMATSKAITLLTLYIPHSPQ